MLKFQKILLTMGLSASIGACIAEARSVTTNLASAFGSNIVVHVHWLGKSGISKQTNAAGFMNLWNLPESTRLETEVIDKLSGAPWRELRHATNQDGAKLVGPLLRDLIDNESYVEIRQPSNTSYEAGEMVLAIRLSSRRAELWKTNLATALESLTGIRPVTARDGWSIKKHHFPNYIQLGRVGDWTVLGAAEDQNKLFDETVAHIKRDHAPFAASGMNPWLEADIDVSRIAALLRHGTNLAATLPDVSLTITGDGQNVLTRGQLIFPELAPLVLEPWVVPTNLINADLFSFTALRGWKPKFVQQFWSQFETNPMPNQFYLWSDYGNPMETYFAAPQADASNAVSKLSDYILKNAGPWMATNDLIRFEKAKTFNGLESKGAPYLFPFLKSTEIPAGNFVFGGFIPQPASPKSAPEQMIRQIESETNLVYYDRESTGDRIDQLTYILQFLRLVAGRPQLASRSPAMQWLRSMGQKLGTSGTEIVLTGPRRLSFSRSSAVPFTAIELQVLADWVESPGFPEFGLLHPSRH